MTDPMDAAEHAAETEAEDVEVVDALPVPDTVPVREAPAVAASSADRGLVTVGPVAVQAAAVAVTGFAAGAATVAVVRRRRARKAAARGARRRKERLLGEVRATRSFLVDISLVDR